MRDGEYVVAAFYARRPLVVERHGIFGVTARGTTLLATYYSGRTSERPYLVPGSDRVLMIHTGGDYDSGGHQIRLHGTSHAKNWYPPNDSSTPLIGLDERGALFAASGRIVRWGLHGGTSTLLKADEAPEGYYPYLAFPDQDLVGFRNDEGVVTFRRLSDPTVQLWDTALVPDNGFYDPLAVSPDGTRLVTVEGDVQHPFAGGKNLVVRRIGDGKIVSSIELYDDARGRPARFGKAVWKNDGAYLLEVLSRGRAGILRCNLKGFDGYCSYAVPSTSDAQLSRF